MITVLPVTVKTLMHRLLFQTRESGALAVGFSSDFPPSGGLAETSGGVRNHCRGLSRFIWLLRRQGNVFIHPQKRRRYKTLRLVSASRRQLLVNPTNCPFVTVHCPFLSPAPGTANANWLHRRLGSYFIPAKQTVKLNNSNK